MPEQTLTGSCLCGALKFTITGVPVRFYHCHCKRCRKASGTGHASNLFVKDASLDWQGDTSTIRHFKLPEAERFARSFCEQCGSPLPRDLPEFNTVFVPAGSLNEEPNIKPQARIFQDSRVAWSCDAVELPMFEAYPK